MMIEETWINKTENYTVGESGPIDPYTENIGDLYKSLVSEYGRCTGRIYIDLPGKVNPCPIGWVFLKRTEYTDTGETYLQETWVHVLEKPDTVVRTKHYYFLK